MKQNKIRRREMAAARSDHDRLGKRVCGHVCERTRTRTRLRQLRGRLELAPRVTRQEVRRQDLK